MYFKKIVLRTFAYILIYLNFQLSWKGCARATFKYIIRNEIVAVSKIFQVQKTLHTLGHFGDFLHIELVYSNFKIFIFIHSTFSFNGRMCLPMKNINNI